MYKNVGLDGVGRGVRRLLFSLVGYDRPLLQLYEESRYRVIESEFLSVVNGLSNYFSIHPHTRTQYPSARLPVGKKPEAT